MLNIKYILILNAFITLFRSVLPHVVIPHVHLVVSMKIYNISLYMTRQPAPLVSGRQVLVTNRTKKLTNFFSNYLGLLLCARPMFVILFFHCEIFKTNSSLISTKFETSLENMTCCNRYILLAENHMRYQAYIYTTHLPLRSLLINAGNTIKRGGRKELANI